MFSVAAWTACTVVHVLSKLNWKIVPHARASDSETSVAEIVVRKWNDICPDGSWSPVSIQTQSLALRALRKRNKQPIMIATASTEHSYWLALSQAGLIVADGDHYRQWAWCRRLYARVWPARDCTVRSMRLCTRRLVDGQEASAVDGHVYRKLRKNRWASTPLAVCMQSLKCMLFVDPESALIKCHPASHQSHPVWCVRASAVTDEELFMLLLLLFKIIYSYYYCYYYHHLLLLGYYCILNHREYVGIRKNK